MLRIAICDDDLLELSHISKLLKAYQEQRNIIFRFDAYSSSTQLLETMKKNFYDILLLDVLMPGITGIQAAREIREYNSEVKIIFLTSSPEYAVDSYAVDAYYYLLKPATVTNLYPILDKLLHKAQQAQDCISLKYASGITCIAYEKLEFVEVMNKKLYFHLVDSSSREVSGSLSEYETRLLYREEFIKIHRSYIINMGCIQELKQYEITTLSGQRLSVSRLLYAQVREAYMRHLFVEKGVE